VTHVSLEPLLVTLRALVSWLEAEKIPHVIIGGVAVGLLGDPRVTKDVDALALLDPDRWESFVAAGEEFGFVPRREDALAFARKARVLLFHHRPGGIDVDISFGALPFEEEAVSRAHLLEIAPGFTIRLANPADLIVMKAIAHRGNDLIDLERVLRRHPEVDLERIRNLVADFASLLEMPEIIEDLDAIISRVGKNRKKPPASTV